MRLRDLGHRSVFVDLRQVSPQFVLLFDAFKLQYRRLAAVLRCQCLLLICISAWPQWTGVLISGLASSVVPSIASGPDVGILVPVDGGDVHFVLVVLP